MKKQTIYALGFFDGVHLGHQALLTACLHLAERTHCAAGVITFDTHPEALLSGKSPALITTVADRQRLLAGFGMEQITVLPFDEMLMQKPWQIFLEELVEQGAAGFVCGEDFRFGFLGEGTALALANFCKERNLYWSVVSDREIDGIRVSSTYIRQLLETGEMEQAVRFLGHPYILSGAVVAGRGLGHTIGTPTANLVIHRDLIQPKRGVYACVALVDGKQYPAVTNIGHRPTVGGHHVTVEPWLLDFSGDLYGEWITLHFYKFLRPEEKFPSLSALQSQIHTDAELTRSIISRVL